MAERCHSARLQQVNSRNHGNIESEQKKQAVRSIYGNDDIILYPHSSKVER